MESNSELSQFATCFTFIKEEKPVIILVNGKQVQMPSGKSAWKNMRAAKLAFNSGLKTGLWHMARTSEDYWRRDPNSLYRQAEKIGWTNLRNQLVEQGIVEFKN